MSAIPLLEPSAPAILLIDQQAGLACRMEAAGAMMTSWPQVLLKLQRDWTRKESYSDARAIVEAHADGYGIWTGLRPEHDPPRVKPATVPATIPVSDNFRIRN